MLINQPPPELFAERPIRSDFSSGLSYRTRRLITISVVALIITASLFQMYGHFHMRSPNGIPTIRAEGTYKQRPDQPGGLDIPHQDVDVYKSLDGSHTTKETVERLLPPSEVPQSLASVPTADLLTKPSLVQESSRAEKSENLVGGSEDNIKLSHDNPASIVTDKQDANTLSEGPLKITNNVFVSDVAKPSDTIVTPRAIAATAKNNAPEPVEVNEPEHTAVTVPDIEAQHNLEKTDSMVKTDSVVQLASISEQEAADKAMEQYQSLYSSILGSLKLRVNRADLGDKGIHYRVQTEKISVSEANRICQSLKKQNVRCIVVR